MHPGKNGISELTNEVELHLADWYGGGARLVSPVPQLRSLPRSFFVRYQIRKDGKVLTPLLVKIPRRPEVDNVDDALSNQKPRTSVRKEYDILVACSNIFRGTEPSNFSAIRPLGFLPGWNAIAMEELDARPLTLLRFHGSTLNRLLHRAGSWLSIFHDRIGEIEPAFLDAEHLRSEIDLHLKRLHATALSPIEDLSPLQESLGRLADSVHNAAVPVVHLHGDFKCRNILVTPEGRVAASDSKMRSRGPIYLDLAKILVDLLSQKGMLLTGGLLTRPSVWKASILDGYFVNSRYDARVLDYYCALALLDKWKDDEYILRRRNPGGRFLTSYIRHYFKKLLQEYQTA